MGGYTNQRLQDHLASLDLPVYGSKKVLLARIRSHYSETTPLHGVPPGLASASAKSSAVPRPSK
eukprot:1374829-Karenia_brevis.AAC.1